MLSYQRSSFWSRQSCSQSVDGDEGAFEPLHFAVCEQLWLAYKECSKPPAATRSSFRVTTTSSPQPPAPSSAVADPVLVSLLRAGVAKAPRR